jgi:hypothetical protein
LFERSELSEALAELIERSEKRKSECASEVGGRNDRVGASRSGLLKNGTLSQCGGGEHKKRIVGGVGEEMGGYCCFAKVYSCFSRARGLTIYLFFLLIIGFKGCIVYNTVLENLYDNIL